MLNCIFIDDCTSCIDRLHVNFDNIIEIGDLNYDLIKLDKSQHLHTMCDKLDFNNLINTPTCYIKDAHPSMLDIILTNRLSFLCKVTNFTCGISDWHNIISCEIKGAAPPPDKRKIKCHSCKHFDDRVFSEPVSVLLLLSTGLMKWIGARHLTAMSTSQPFSIFSICLFQRQIVMAK